MKKLFFLFFLLTFGLLFGQNPYQVFDKAPKIGIDYLKQEIDIKNSNDIDNERTYSTLQYPIFVGKMWNAYSTQGSYTNQIFTDPYSGLIAVVHIGSRIFPTSGAIVYQMSNNGGYNWTSEIGPVASLNFNGRHPNIAISNPTQNPQIGFQHIVTSFSALVNGTWNYIVFATDTNLSGSQTIVHIDSVYFPNDEMFINSQGGVFTTAQLVNYSIVGSDTIMYDLFYSTDGGISWNKRAIAKTSDFENGEINGMKGFINYYGIGYIVAQAKKPGQNFYTFAYKKTTDHGLTWDSVWTWVNPFLLPEVQGKVHALNYEVDVVTDLKGNLNFVGTFVDTVNSPPNNNTGIYHIFGNGNFWKGNLISKVNKTYQSLPGGLVTLNECELAAEFLPGRNSPYIFIKWADTPEGDSLYDLHGVIGYPLGEQNYFYLNLSRTNTPSINEKFSQMSSVLNYTSKTDIIYTIFGNNDTNDLAEAELWYTGFQPMVDYAEDEYYPPVKFYLSQNFPNPFNYKTNLEYFVPYEFNGNVVIKVYNLIGEEVETLVDAHKQPGLHRVTFNGDNLPSGVYIFELKAKNTIKRVKGILLK